MQILLTPQESEDFFHRALCNAVGTGYMDSYGLEFICNSSDYDKAKETLWKQTISTPAYEDVLMQVLRQGNTMQVIDHECDGEYSRNITLYMVHNRVCNAPMRHLIDMHNEDDDAETADAILQTVAFNEIIFG